MDKEHRETLDRVKHFFENYKNIPDEKLHEECMKNFVDLTPSITASKDDEVLVELLTFFEREFDYDLEGVCEDLKSQIGSNFTLNQLLKAFYKKFDYLIRNDIEICVEMASWFFYWGKFDGFRDMFNTVKSNKSAEFLLEFDRWYGKKLNDKIALLRDDMKNWCCDRRAFEE